QTAAAPLQEQANTSEPPAKAAHKAHKTADAEPIPAGFEPTSTVAPGSYSQGLLPPIFSPFANQPAPTGETAEAAPESEKPARAHHSVKKAVDEAAENAE